MGAEFWAFKFGDLLPMFGALVAAAAFLYRRGGQDSSVTATLEALTKQITELQSEIKKIGEVLINQADQNRRIIHLEEDLRDLRKGRGWVQNDIDGEYTRHGKVK